ncbi:hypothetical protein RhiJN_25342 [Ceratobasidium sp. AG-Ba]|nr:hypothetical protein RhiJN_25342 [Ceratobasidium sp. AG-Ba]
MLLQKCPNVSSLELYPENEATHSNDDPEDKVASSYTFAALANFNAICTLESTSAIIQGSMLELLGSLPHLRSLKVQVVHGTSPEHWDPSKCDPLSREAFPKLTELQLHLSTSGQVKRFWELAPLGLLKNVDVYVYDCEEDADLQFIPLICESSPQITSLSLRFPYLADDEDEDEDYIHIDSDVFEYLAQLPLSGIFELRNSILVVDDPWSRMGTAWPNIECIFCDEQIMILGELVALSSRAPKLRMIRCDFSFEDSLVETGWPWRLQAINPVLEEMMIKEASLKEYVLNDDPSLSDLAR